jgi:hypothetical protein
MGMAGVRPYPNPITNIEDSMMNTKVETPLRHQLTNQPSTWPWLYLLPQTHYVKRQRAANSPEYDYRPQPVKTDSGPTSKRPSYLQRGINKLAAARNKAWLALKRFGREVIHCLVKWCLLPLAIAACFAMVDVAPAELPVDHYTIGEAALMKR